MTKIEDRPPLARNTIARRTAKGWSQMILAQKVGVHLNVIKKIEGGHGEGEPATREAIAGALGCKTADLYRDESVILPEPFSVEWKEAARLLDAIVEASPLRQLIALYVATFDKQYLDQIRALPDSAPTLRFLKSLPPN
jgi:transcriptional regulator with XRE-family HTH domain